MWIYLHSFIPKCSIFPLSKYYAQLELLARYILYLQILVQKEDESKKSSERFLGPSLRRIGGDSCQTRSLWRSKGEATSQDMLAPECSPIHHRLLGREGLNPALGLITSCCCHQTAQWRPACCWQDWGSMSIGEPSTGH